MRDNQCQTIEDNQGNNLKYTNFKQLIKENIWNIMEKGFATCIPIFGIINLLISKNYFVSCANYYGVDRRYFSGTDFFKIK